MADYRKMTLASHVLVSTSMLMLAMTSVFRAGHHYTSPPELHLEHPEQYELALASNEFKMESGYVWEKDNRFAYCYLYETTANYRDMGYLPSPGYWDKAWCWPIVTEPFNSNPLVFESPEVAAMLKEDK